MCKSREDATLATADIPSTAGTPTAWEEANNIREANSDPKHWKQPKPSAGETSAAVGMAAIAETPASRDPVGERTAVIKTPETLETPEAEGMSTADGPAIRAETPATARNSTSTADRATAIAGPTAIQETAEM
jgi:hypothetical protein